MPTHVPQPTWFTSNIFSGPPPSNLAAHTHALTANTPYVTGTPATAHTANVNAVWPPTLVTDYVDVPPWARELLARLQRAHESVGECLERVLQDALLFRDDDVPL